MIHACGRWQGRPRCGSIPAMSPQAYIAIIAMCPDRPGLVAIVSEYLRDRGANIADSRMAVLGAEFGIMVLASGTEAQVERIEREIPGLKLEAGFDIIARRTQSPTDHRHRAAVPCVVTTDAIDHEGIVHAVSMAIHQLGVNIVTLEATAYPAPESGAPLFRLEARIEVPPDRPVDDVRKALAVVAERENLQIELKVVA
jgi:glycine cleavage system transcriptional repressor